MLRKLCVLTVFLLALALPAAAQVNYCTGGGMACEYLRNQAFADQPTTTYPTPNQWVIGNSAWWVSVTDPCAWGGGSSLAAKLPAGGGVLQEFTATSFAHWSVDFDAYFGDTGGTTNDTIKVYVRNLNTNVEEIFSIDATQYGLCASNVSFNLANDYSNANVRVTLKRGLKSTMNQISVDNVSFWGSIY
jgi:hypothetical protein